MTTSVIPESSIEEAHAAVAGGRPWQRWALLAVGLIVYRRSSSVPVTALVLLLIAVPAATFAQGWGFVEGTVTEVHHDDVSRTTKGQEVTRKGSDDDPAYVIEQEDGTTVLKLRSEVERA